MINGKRAFIALPSAQWADDRLNLGGCWPLSLAIADLRFWDCALSNHMGHKPPSIRELATLWGWDRNRVYRLVRNGQKWVDEADPNRGAFKRVRQKRDSSETPERGLTLNIAPNRDTGETARDSTLVENPRVRDTFVPSTKVLESAKADGPLAAQWTEAVDAWVALCVRLGRPARRLQKTRGLGPKLRARIREDSLEAVLDVFEWFETSQHSRAKFLREKGYGLKQLVNPDKFDDYLGLARMGDTSGAPRPGQWFEPDPLPDPTIGASLPLLSSANREPEAF